MDTASIKSLRATMTLHFAVIAVLTAMLVSHGSGSAFLPLFILVVCATAFVLVDSLEWFALNRLAVFIGMLVGTAYAVGSYLYNTFAIASESGQLQAIAGLLVFPEAVLFMQRKNLRVFEQLAIFLLLEIMVAALVNDNLLFGLLLLPIVLLWVSSLFLFSRYATLVHIAPHIEVPMPKLAELMYAKFVKSIMGDEKPKPIVESNLLSSGGANATLVRRRIFQSIPLGIGAVMFSALFFYCLPRTTSGGYRPKLGTQARVGLPGTMTLGQVGRALQDPTPVMRVKFTDEKTKSIYPVTEGPYIRARVYDSFRRFGDSTSWYLAPPTNFKYYPIPDVSRLLVDAIKNRDRVNVEFDLLPSCQIDTFTLPPTYLPRESRQVHGKIGTYTQLLQTEQPSGTEERHMQAYTLGSTAYENGRQLDIMPVLPTRSAGGISNFLREYLPLLINYNPADYPSVDKLRARILRDASVAEGKNLDIARAVEQFFSAAGEFKYTLDLTAEADPNLDPIEDFVANHRAGHCQYFAATMLIMLRQSAIPSRLVVGYKPREYNSIGGYFHVRQKDAHAWVEARFSARELVGTEYEHWTAPNSDYWIRFDPTPGESSQNVVAQPNSIGDYATRLWKGYVLEGRELTGEKSLYAPVTEKSKDIYSNLALQWQKRKEVLLSGKFGTEAGSIDFAWPLAILVTSLGIAIVLLWQVIIYLPKLAPKLAKRIGLTARRADFNQEFFTRCVRILRSVGFERDESQTPQELTQEAAQYLEREKGVAASSEWLRVLTQSYYRLRFGSGPALSDHDQAEVQAALKSLEKSTARMPLSNR